MYVIDDLTGGLELSHTIELSAKDFPGLPGSVREMKWTPDGCAVILAWSKGGISLWSTFGTMLMCSLGWDYGLNVDLATKNPLDIIGMVSWWIVWPAFSPPIEQNCLKLTLDDVLCIGTGLVHRRLSVIHAAAAENIPRRVDGRCGRLKSIECGSR